MFGAVNAFKNMRASRPDLPAGNSNCRQSTADEDAAIAQMAEAAG